jgi:hypothetical protein
VSSVLNGPLLHEHLKAAFNGARRHPGELRKPLNTWVRDAFNVDVQRQEQCNVASALIAFDAEGPIGEPSQQGRRGVLMVRALV